MLLNSDQRRFIEKVAFKDVNKLTGDSKAFTKEELIKIEKNIKKDIDEIDELFKNEVINIGNHVDKLNFIILAEAPQSADNYFYKEGREGNFMSLLNKLNDKNDISLKEFLTKKGILILDIYKYPLPSIFYNSTGSEILYDDEFFSNRLELLNSKNLIDRDTLSIFRYKKLINNSPKEVSQRLTQLHIQKPHPQPLGSGPRASILSKEMQKLIKNKIK